MITEYKINWAIPENIGYFISTNKTGNSKGKYKHANFSDQVGEDSKNVESNINELKTLYGLNDITFMNQTHSNTVLKVSREYTHLDCDAMFTEDKTISCAVLTADCIPILVTESSGRMIGCIHAGWRGLQSKIIENFFSKFKSISKSNFRVLLGPCISAQNYEVSDEIFCQFSNYSDRFRKNKSGNYYMDLRYIACDILNELGITNVTISKSCTYNDNFYSYRKDKTTGRFVSLIWFKE